MTTNFFIEKVLDAFSSMKTTDNVKLEDRFCLKQLQKYYIDPFGYLSNIMQSEDNFIIGRRGTGKSTLLYRAFAECIETWNSSKNQYKKRILPIYLDLSKCDSIISSEDIKFEEHFTYELLRCLEKDIQLVWEEIVPTNGEYQESTMHDDLKSCILQIQDMVKTGTVIKIDSGEEKYEQQNTLKKSSGLHFSLKSPSIDTNKSSESQVQKESTLKKHTTLTLSQLLDSLSELCELIDISSIYVFIDEYSELDPHKQKVLANLLKRLRGTRKNIYFKVCAITDNYELGEIRLQRDFYEISLDLYKLIERSNGLQDGFKTLGDFTEKIIQERLNVFECNITISKLFNSSQQAIVMLTRASMGVPRTLGIILKEAWNQTTSKGKKKISLDALRFGINTSGDGYFGFFNGNVGPVIPKFYDDMLQSILNRARDERKSHTDKASNMFLIGGFRDNHFKYLTENYLVHLLKKNETSVKGETGLSLYMIDQYFINKYNLGFTLERDIYRQQRFVYNDIMKIYDVYFTDTRKQFFCPKCQTEYTQEQLYLPQLDTYLTVCPKDNVLLKELQHEFTHSVTYTETERKIIGTIRNHNYQNSLLAKDVAEIVGCSTSKVAKFSEKLSRETDLIYREKPKSESRYRYYIGKELI